MHHRWKIAWSCALQEWRQLASHSRNLKNCPQVSARRWTDCDLSLELQREKDSQEPKIICSESKIFYLLHRWSYCLGPHRSKCAYLTKWWVENPDPCMDFDGLALHGSHTIYHTLPHTTSLQGSHAWGVFARRLVELYPDRLRAIQHLGWRERADKVMLSFKNMFFTKFSGGSCHCCQVSSQLWSNEA